ncbi:hypothetical protein QJQ58_15720 [Paenibacillus dendritiformis]|uniref:hypothetical protein n=1 Tax=Paenibacillus dendritiformis TaxID=130049 RepID=UPI00248B3452|nr:hypothetical protein [Paenibacillus dendritiformis]WGU92060.1 hypothetical protein QJQ58_15720 [Paenibacillus dendritiformis]
MTNANEPYIIIPRSVFYDHDKYNHLSPEELYIFAWLYRHRLYAGDNEWMTMLSINDISQCIRLRASNGKDDTRNKVRIKEILITLKQKGYINPAQNINKDTPYHQLLDIFYPEYRGYDKNIKYDIFDNFKDEPSEFMIYACIDRRGEEGRNISFKSWEKIMGHKKEKLENLFKKMNTDEYHTRIWKFSGEYYTNEKGEIRQEINEYYTRPSESVKNLWYQSNNVKRSKQKKETNLAFGRKGGTSKDWGDENPF